MSDSNKAYDVLFLGNGNTARTIMAEAILKREGRGNFRVHSAGINAQEEFDAHAIDLLRRMNLELPAGAPKGWSAYAGAQGPQFDFIFTMCESAVLLPRSMWNGNPLVAHWSIPNPALADGNEAEIRLAYADAFRMIANRVSLFTSLPLAALNRAAMSAAVAAIEPKRAESVAA